MSPERAATCEKRSIVGMNDEGEREGGREGRREGGREGALASMCM